ncbi:MAG: hypothetical protein JWO06_3441 [Bacteroidota bacterium]|nr:hypothetical protein [Bacteroidota bacterium]
MKLSIAIVAVFCAISFSSCKKDYVCTCIDAGLLDSFVIPQATKAQAATICKSREAYPQGGTKTATCNL